MSIPTIHPAGHAGDPLGMHWQPGSSPALSARTVSVTANSLRLPVPNGRMESCSTVLPLPVCLMLFPHSILPLCLAMSFRHPSSLRHQQASYWERVQFPFFQALLVFAWDSYCLRSFPGGSVVKHPPANAGDTGDWRFDPWVGKIPLEKEMATHFSILAWRIPWTE